MESVAAPVIRLTDISKSFGKVHANRDINLDFYSGRIKALLGENGAGKSTLMSMLAGRLQPDRGTIRVDGVTVSIDDTHKAYQLGIGMVYQHFMLVDGMTVAENVLLGQADTHWLSPKRMTARVAQLARRYGLNVDPTAKVADLSMGERQRIEILKLLHRQCRVLIFDEPTSVLTPPEIEQLFQALKQMANDQKAIVFISHKLGEVMELADEIAILRKGQVIDELPRAEVNSQTDLALKMVGREVLLQVERSPMILRQQVLRIDAMSGDGLHHVDLQLRQGEILGIVGVAGNGQKPLVEIVCGLRSPKSGTVKILGKEWRRFYGQFTWDRSLIYVPEDRRGLAVCLDMSLADNLLLTTRKAFCRGPWLRRKMAREKTRQLIDEFDVQPPQPDLLARRLSGGNLQKMVLAREFFRRPRLVVAEQPTQGLDIGATEDIWQVLLKAREEAGILLITGDLNEALSLSDRIAVLYNGHIMDTFPVADIRKVEAIGLMMAGMTIEENDDGSAAGRIDPGRGD